MRSFDEFASIPYKGRLTIGGALEELIPNRTINSFSDLAEAMKMENGFDFPWQKNYEWEWPPEAGEKFKFILNNLDASDPEQCAVLASTLDRIGEPYGFPAYMALGRANEEAWLMGLLEKLDSKDPNQCAIVTIVISSDHTPISKKMLKKLDLTSPPQIAVLTRTFEDENREYFQGASRTFCQNLIDSGHGNLLFDLLERLNPNKPGHLTLLVKLYEGLTAVGSLEGRGTVLEHPIKNLRNREDALRAKVGAYGNAPGGVLVAAPISPAAM